MRLTTESKKFLSELHHQFNKSRLSLLQTRRERDLRWKQGDAFATLPETKLIRDSVWQVAKAPKDLEKRHVEITGPAEPKMIINALNSGADVFMADLEDSLSPTWEKIITGQEALFEAVRKTLKLTIAGKSYQLKDQLATLVVRPRGLHLPEKHFEVDGELISGSLFDFGLYFFWNAKYLLENGSGPYFYLPKLESHLEAKWWNDVFVWSQNQLKIPQGSIRATVLIETAPAAFEMEEIIYQLKDHMSGLNAGRWDYIFSFIKKFHDRKDFIFPDRKQVTMTVPHMQAYCEKIVEVCHRRGAHAMGGMSAFIPNRAEPEVTASALKLVQADKKREVELGFDGTWVAHPDLISLARSEFEKVLGTQAHQKKKALGPVPSDAELQTLKISEGKITQDGVRNNIFVALVYIDNWLEGTGAVAIHNLMEDAATAEISRCQLWQWIHHKCALSDGRILTAELFLQWLAEELSKAKEAKLLENPLEVERTLRELVLSPELTDFLTLKCYMEDSYDNI